MVVPKIIEMRKSIIFLPVKIPFIADINKVVKIKTIISVSQNDAICHTINTKTKDINENIQIGKRANTKTNKTTKIMLGFIP